MGLECNFKLVVQAILNLDLIPRDFRLGLNIFLNMIKIIYNFMFQMFIAKKINVWINLVVLVLVLLLVQDGGIIFFIFF